MGTYDQLAKLEPSSTGSNMKISKLKSTQTRDNSRDISRVESSDKSLKMSNNYPTRDEIQEFSFQLRDDLKVKVQAEVPYKWQKELEEIARQLNVKKLELYRFMIGEFLWKVKRKDKD